MSTSMDNVGRPKATKRSAFEKLPAKDAVETVLLIQRQAFLRGSQAYPESSILRQATGFDKVKLDMQEYLPGDCDRLFIEYGLTRLLSKCAVGADRKACKKAALETSLAAERQCANTNKVFSAYQAGAFSFLPRIAWCLHDAKSELRRLFGDLNEDDVMRCAAFGPGVSLGHRGMQPTKVDKLATSVVTGTPYALRLWAREFPYFSLLTPGLVEPRLDGVDLPRVLSRGGASLPEPQSLSVVYHDEWTNVPKDRHTDRGICVSPTANVRYQKGLGAAMRLRLSSWGIHLQKQAGVNSELARKGSLGEGFDTIDLRSASDTVSSSVVRFLFEGTDCLRMMEGLRTPYTVYPDRQGTHELTFLSKFSAMGNGYTFELETAIFAAIVRSACRFLGMSDSASDHTWSVFGDDICLPSCVTPLVLELLDVLGFIVNEDKSFTSGYFRESCGTDWFCGVNIRPYFFKSAYINDITLTRFANGFRRWCDRSYGSIGVLDGRFRAVWRLIIRQITQPLTGYTYADDSTLLVCETDFDVARPKGGWNHQQHVIWRKGYGIRTRNVSRYFSDETLYAFSLHTGKLLQDGVESYLIQSLGDEAFRTTRVPCKGDARCHRWSC